jgi:hypothetical protein
MKENGGMGGNKLRNLIIDDTKHDNKAREGQESKDEKKRSDDIHDHLVKMQKMKA